MSDQNETLRFVLTQFEKHLMELRGVSSSLSQSQRVNPIWLHQWTQDRLDYIEHVRETITKKGNGE